MEKEEKRWFILGFLSALLTALLILVGAYEFFIKDNKNTENNNVNNNQQYTDESNLTELKKILNFNDDSGSDLGIKLYFERYLNTILIPNHRINDKLASYKVSNLNDDEISMFVWRYIHNNGNYVENVGWEMYDSVIDELLKNYLNLDNYVVKELELQEEPKAGEDWNIFGLKHQNDKYIASVVPTEFSFWTYRVSDVKYDLTKKEVLINFDSYDLPFPNRIEIGDPGVATFKIRQDCQSDVYDCSEYPAYLDKVEYKEV